MRFLSVADRELRSAARQKATYRTRWMTAVIFFGLLVWLLWAFGGFTNRRAAPGVFRVLSVLTFLYCLFLGTARTADCISVERREGTLGLLFLTNLNSAEIIGGKLCSSALASVYGLMAIFPMLALPLLMGGITFGHFARTVAGLLNGILFALAAGFLASVVCKRQFTAIALALGLTVGFAGGLMLGAAAASSYGPTRPLASCLAAFSPLHTLMAADGTRGVGPSRFWLRACASLALGRNADAAEDVLAGLRLARLARQLPDAGSTARVQVLLTRSLQPLWEGLSQQAWTEPQLAALQHELAGLNPLADYTNAVRRVVLAHIEVWRAIPDSTNSYIVLPASDGGYRREPAWQLQPRSWWFESCIQLHNAGRNAIEQVDIAADRIHQGMNWSDLSGLPLESPSTELFQQSSWWGAYPASVAYAQTSVNQATIACALEHFRLGNGVYPETLEQLVPALLARVPHDAVSGRPMIYQPVGEGSFILRGVGPNGMDDRKNNPSGDWLWTYSTITPSAKK